MASDDAEFCHLCGSRDNLSFEHIPPRRCFNNAPTSVVEMVYKTLPDGRSLSLAPERRYRRGMGRRSLCSPCNSITGDLYGTGFFDWTCQASRYADKVGRDNRVELLFQVKPLHVLKQLATMAVAASEVSPAAFHRYLRDFIRVPYARYTPPELAFHAYLNPPAPHNRAYPSAGGRVPLPLTRMTPACAVLDVSNGNRLMLFAEIAFPPLGYVVRFREEGSPLPEQVRDMPDISYFGRYAYNQTTTVSLRLPVRIPVGPSPGHYLG